MNTTSRLAMSQRPDAPGIEASEPSTHVSWSTYLPHAVTSLPCHLPLPKWMPVKYVVAAAEAPSAATSMCCVVSACWEVTGARLADE